MFFITSKTPTNVARAQIQAWQEQQEHALLDHLAGIVKAAQAQGLEKKRIGRMLSMMGDGLSGETTTA